MKKILLASAMFLFSFQTSVFCQADNPVLSNAVSKLTAELSGHVAEKAYLQFDRPQLCYLAGDTLYFKAYVTMAEKHELSAISGMLHVDLIDKNDAILQTITLSLKNGIGWGDFALPDTLHKGSYRIRAYTQYMRNDKHPYFFDQFISVGSLNNVDRVAGIAGQSGATDLQFFPEGGNLVVDLPSKVAFKAVGPDGLGVNVSGVVLDNDNKEVAKLSSAHFGMGAFYLLPEAGKTYKARVTYADGAQATVNLPAIEDKGITLAVNNDDPAKVSIEIKANRAYYKENLNKDYNILIYNAGDVRTVTTKLDNSILGLDLPSNGFRTGVVQVTLLSGTGEPLNERLAFVQNNDLLNLSVGTGKQLFAKRENVQLNINAKNKDGQLVNGYFSVSVTDESKIAGDEDAENTILSYLLLKSELKGFIEKPNYYFLHNTKETRAALDALMLTQGFRRFTWKQLLDNNNAITANVFSPEKVLNVSGVLATKAGMPLANTNVFLIQGSGGSVLTQITDASGRFNFSNLAFYDGTRFILKSSAKITGKNVPVIRLDKTNAAPVLAADNTIDTRYNRNADILASIQGNTSQGAMTASNEAVLIDNSDHTATDKKNDYRSTKLGGAGNADQVLFAKDFLNAPTLSQGINGLLRGIYIKDGVPYLADSQTYNAGNLVSEPMMVVLDGVPFTSSNGIDSLDPNDVETIEVLRGANAGLYGIRAGSGVMSITTRQTRQTSSDNKEMAAGVFSINPAGFYKAREFYAPAYAADQTSNGTDTRTTIFWKPDVTTGVDGNASFNFFNADGTGTYRVVVEGIDEKGNLGRQVYRYKVQ